MPSRLHFTIYFILSLALHALVIAAAVFLVNPGKTPLPAVTPVRIVNLPKDTLKTLPPIEEKIPEKAIPRPIIPREVAPAPKMFDKSDILRLPQTAPTPKAMEKGGETVGGKGSQTTEHSIQADKKRGPLPFLSQQEINELANKGYADDKLRNDVLSQDEEAYKFLPYGRALFGKINKNLRFPELAAITGLQGDVEIIFEIKKDGSLGDITVTKSSGYIILDNEVIRSIRDAAPFQPLPPEWNKERIIIPAVGIFRIYYKGLQ